MGKCKINNVNNQINYHSIVNNLLLYRTHCFMDINVKYLFIKWDNKNETCNYLPPRKTKINKWIVLKRDPSLNMQSTTVQNALILAVKYKNKNIWQLTTINFYFSICSKHLKSKSIENSFSCYVQI